MKSNLTRSLLFFALFASLHLSAQNMVITTQVAPSFCGICNGAIMLTVTGGVPPYTYSWSNGVTTKDINNLCSGSYTVWVTDEAGQTQTFVVFVEEIATTLTLSTCVTDASCFGQHTGSIQLTVTGGGGPQNLTYSWSNGATTQNLSSIMQGTYSVTVSVGGQCTQSTSATVNAPPNLQLTWTTVNPSSAGASNGVIDLTVTGGVPPYSAFWTSDLNGPAISTSMDLTGMPAGTYCVTVTDANGCTRSQCITLGAGGPGGGNPPPLALNTTVNNSGCGANCTGSLNVTVTGGSAPYTWILPNGAVGTAQQPNFSITNLCPNTYCVTVTTANGLTTSGCYTVGQGQTQYIKINSTNTAFCNVNSGTGPLTCEMVCPRSTVSYFVEPSVNCGVTQSLAGASWTVSGAEQFTVSPNGRTVTVTWGSAGPGLVKFSSSNQQICFESLQCVTIVEEPEAKFSTDPPNAPNTTMQVCKGQTVSFKNESLNAEQYEWQFSDDLSILNTENTQHTFRTPGNHSVTLIARSNCLCADTTVLLVEVLDTEPPLLDCVGSVCPGETVTYSTSSNCSAYTWQVSPNGSVLQGGQAGDNTITVQWGDGPTGSISLAATGCAGSACPQASVFNISIISDNAEIRGKEFVCPNSEEEYSIELFDGTEYIWSLSSGGGIVRGQGTNKVSVAWTGVPSSVTHWLIVDYYNCYLGCGGTDSIPVRILWPFYIAGPVEMCDGSNQAYQAKTTGGLNVACLWSVFAPNGSLLSTSTGASLNFTPTAGPGTYRFFAVPNIPGQTCSPDAELRVMVAARPPKPVSISGPIIVCPGTPLTYNVPGNPPYQISWQTGNGTPANQIGNPVNVTWNSNPTHWLSAAQVSLDGLGCRSDTARLNVQNVANISISGPPGLCEGTVGYYESPFYPNFEYLWEILPATAGTIKQGQGKNAVEIFWQTPGTHTLRVSTCGLSIDFSVTVWANPEPLPLYPDGLCPGDSGLVTLSDAFAAYRWEMASGGLLGTGASINLPSGPYAVEVTSAQGCKGSAEFRIAAYPKPNVSVTTADPAGFCNNSRYVSLTALVPHDGTYSYQWLHDGNPVGTDNVVYITNQYGFFTVEVANEYGCTATAPPLLLYNYCAGDCGGFCPLPPHPPCPPATVQPVADFTSRCDSFGMVLNDYSGLYVPGSAVWWTGISGTTGWEFGVGDSVHFVYPNAGKYIIVVKAVLSNGMVCTEVDSLDVEAVAHFSHNMACPGDSTLFKDESSRLPEMDIVQWNWDFGDPGNTNHSNEPSPGNPYPNSGTYMATLTVTTATGCTSSYSEAVLVPNLPAPAFVPPLANCAGAASEFAPASNAGLTQVNWDFGDPSSGALNQSSANTAYHNFAVAGTYNVTLSAKNTYGCTASITQAINITPNPFSGIITPPTAAICQGSSLTLNAPLGPGAMYLWNGGTNMPTLTVTQAGVYKVTLSNANGCSYSPPPKALTVNPAPTGVIKFLEVNELGQVSGVQYDQAAVCEGETVTLQVQAVGNFTYDWGSGLGNNSVLTFSEDRGNLLSVGTHTFTVTVTNPATGCTAVFAPFTVTVNPVPGNFSLSTNDVCAGTPSTISYAGPQPPEWQIFWNTGDIGPSMTTQSAGQYFVRVVNEHGCSAKSNTVVIFPGPNIAALPSGCHERCNPDTLCLPPLPDIVSWQWFFEGTPIPGATSNQFAATQSGTYWADLVDLNGCAATSAPLTVELYDGFGNILGQVWADVNNNGIIDAGDTLVTGIPVQLLQNGTLVAPNQSGLNGQFDWLNVLSTNYTVQIDTQQLSPLWEIVIFSDSASLTGCGGKVFVNLLVESYTCPGIESAVTLSACPGQTVLFEGIPIMAGQTQVFSYQNLLGCDSVVTVTVSALPVSTSTLSASACPGGVFSYNGMDLAAGQTQDFVFNNWQGCDSVVTVTVSALPVSTSTLNASACPGGVFSYNGVDLAVGQTQDFVLSNWLGCDSVVTVTVSALPVSTSTLNASACPGGVFSYNGVDLAVGQTQDFVLNNWLGCDSVVTVTVSALPVSTFTLSASACPGGVFSYNGVNLAVGQTQDFVLSNWLGCDSVVTVSVSALPVSASTLSASACPGGVFSYNGVDLAVGQTQDFVLSNWQGCDSVVTVTVSALPVSTSTLNAGACPGGFFQYNGVNLAVGQTQDFVLSNWQGCDSVVTVTVFEKPTSSETRTVWVCPGEVYVFQNQTLAAGESREFHLMNGEGCDSTIIILVNAWPDLDFEVETGISCPNAPTGSVSVTVLPGGALPVSYALNGLNFQPGPVFESVPAGIATLTLRDANGCLHEQELSVPASPGLQVSLADAFVIPCDSVSVTLSPQISGDTSALRILWWNGQQGPNTVVSDPGQVWVEASNHCETLRREATVAWADAEGDTMRIFVPNIFAPRSERPENALFRPYFGKNLMVLDYTLEVYDRWGNLVFLSKQPENGWEGRFAAAKDASTAVFVWQLRVRVLFCGREMALYRKGDVTVLR